MQHMYNPTEKWLRARFLPALMLGDNRTAITASERHIALSRRAACEGAVLLKNNGILPLRKGAKIAVFGNAQIDYVKGGGGSGDVYSPYDRNIYEGLKMKGKNDGWNPADAKVELFHPISLFYESYIRGSSDDPTNKYYREMPKNGRYTEPKVPAELMQAAAEFTDTAVITICRHSGEGYDKNANGCYFELEPEEKELVEDVLANFAHVIVLLNTGTMIDTSWFVNEEKVEAALILWQGGMEGGLAAADMLVGDDAPSGKLTDTFAGCLEDYPSTVGFHESNDCVKYTEDIFVGYRYFETIPGSKKAVVYPFGYGLTYTTFKLSDIFVSASEKRIFVSVDVKNTGARAGKEIVQVYYSAPKGKITKEKIALAAFAKTPVIEPGKTATVTMYFDIADMASYDDAGDVKKNAYVLEAGGYKIMVGTSVRDNSCAYTYNVAETRIVKKCKSYCSPKNLGERLMADGTYRPVPARKTAQKAFAPTYHNEYKPREEIIELYDVAEGKATLDEFISQISDTELMTLLTGKRSTGVCNTGGMGGLFKYRVPSIATADGPAGLRLHWQRGVRTTSFPVATAIACSWNTSLAEEIGRAAALECKENNLQIWLAPALNIHRNPLCGRNFEYYSEDPYVSGKMAAAMVRGIQSERVVATPKHFAANNKETNRLDSDSVMSERALREIYLRGFEICVKESAPKLIMSSYNLINGVRTSESGELLTGILRGEWGYEGMVTTDWSNHAEHYKEVKAGNDMRMPCQEGQLKEAYEQGLITRDEMAACVKRVLEMILWVE